MEQSHTPSREPIFSRRALAMLLFPMFLEQLLSVTMGMADTLMVSGIGEAAVSSVSLVDTINVLIIQLFSSLAGGGAVVASQYLGRRDTDNARRAAAQLYTVSLISTVSLAALSLIFCRPVLSLVFSVVDDDVMRFSLIYFAISAVSYPFIGIYNAGAALFRAQGNSRISMMASLVMNVINIAGNALLIYGFQMGVLGAALATLLGRVFAALWVLRCQQHQASALRIGAVAELKPDRSLISRILAIGVPSGLENSMFQIGKLCVSSLISTLGTSAIAANAVANTVSSISTIPGTAVSLAMIPVVGRCLGAGEKKQAKRYAAGLMGLALAGLALTNIALFFAIPEITTWFNLSAQAAEMCARIVRLFCLFSIFFWAASFTLPNALRSGGDARFTMMVSIFSMWTFRVVLSYFFVMQLHWGLTGVWLGMFIDWICRSVFFAVRFAGEKWMTHKVI